LVIIPVQPSPTDLWATKATVELAAKERIPAYILLNRVASNSKLAAGIAAQLDNLLECNLGNRVAFASCLMEGRAVTETDPGSVAAKEIKAMTEEIWCLCSDEVTDLSQVS
jgi:chromosome partitioning protein